jgi:hypothetical protein
MFYSIVLRILGLSPVLMPSNEMEGSHCREIERSHYRIYLSFITCNFVCVEGCCGFLVSSNNTVDDTLTSSAPFSLIDNFVYIVMFITCPGMCWTLTTSEVNLTNTISTEADRMSVNVHPSEFRFFLESQSNDQVKNTMSTSELIYLSILHLGTPLL